MKDKRYFHHCFPLKSLLSDIHSSKTDKTHVHIEDLLKYRSEKKKIKKKDKLNHNSHTYQR